VGILVQEADTRVVCWVVGSRRRGGAGGCAAQCVCVCVCARARTCVWIPTGDIHGQYYDLLRLFEYGLFPPESNYLFLGDYVDRGKQSLETICLLLSFKIKFPENFFILRGNHECASINRIYGAPLPRSPPHPEPSTLRCSFAKNTTGLGLYAKSPFSWSLWQRAQSCGLLGRHDPLARKATCAGQKEHSTSNITRKPQAQNRNP
jgi:hypothetical protein